jgi:hypothetical protein
MENGVAIKRRTAYAPTSPPFIGLRAFSSEVDTGSREENA